MKKTIFILARYKVEGAFVPRSALRLAAQRQLPY